MLNREEFLPLGNADAQPLANTLGQAIRAGLPLESGLRALAEQTRSRWTRSSLLDLSRRLEQGMPLADAIKASKSGLPRQMQALIAAGLETGRLDSVMQYCIEQSQRATSLRQHIWLALSYPLFLMWFSTLICSSILILIVPAMAKIFDDFGTEIPIVTQTLIKTSRFVASFGLLPWCVIIVGGIGFWLIFVIAGFSKLGQRWATSIPMIGRAFRYAALTDFCQILAILSESGLPFPKALNFAGNASDDRWLGRKCKFVARQIERGTSPAISAREAQLPNSLSQVFRESNSIGTFSDALRGLSDIYAAQCHVTVHVSNRFLAYLAVTFVVGFAGTTAIALFVPLIKLLNDLS
jgi:type II secretory pathway component PulF